MVTKSKLKLALAAEKGVDFKKIKQQRKIKAMHRAKATKKKPSSESQDDSKEDEEDYEDISGEEESRSGEESEVDIDYEAMNESDSDDEVEMEEKIERPKKTATTPTASKKDDQKEDEESSDEEEDKEEDIAMSDLEGEDLEDVVPHTRLTINNKDALTASLNRILIPSDESASFTSHMCVVSKTSTANAIPDVSDDVKREDAFLAQCLAAATVARAKLVAVGIPFSRPRDYFAEMVKSDEHMEKIKSKLVEEASAKKASTEARKLRELKKFGKKIQVAKIQERAKEKRETLDKIKNLKRKRQDTTADLGTHESDLFNVAVDNELTTYRNKHEANGRFSGKGINPKRQKKNEKYGFGGKKRYAKSGDATSSSDLSGFSSKRNKVPFSQTRTGGGAKKSSAQRLGKARRKAMAGKR